jgi:hypothetical protein
MMMPLHQDALVGKVFYKTPSPKDDLYSFIDSTLSYLTVAVIKQITKSHQNAESTFEDGRKFPHPSSL